MSERSTSKGSMSYSDDYTSYTDSFTSRSGVEYLNTSAYAVMDNLKKIENDKKKNPTRKNHHI